MPGWKHRLIHILPLPVAWEQSHGATGSWFWGTGLTRKKKIQTDCVVWTEERQNILIQFLKPRLKSVIALQLSTCFIKVQGTWKYVNTKPDYELSWKCSLAPPDPFTAEAVHTVRHVSLFTTALWGRLNNWRLFYEHHVGPTGIDSLWRSESRMR